MASEKTSQLGMHRWGGSEYLRREEINDNFAKLDRLGLHRVEFIRFKYSGYNYLSYFENEYLNSNNITLAINAGAEALAIVPIRRMLTSTSIDITITKVGNTAAATAVRDAKAAGLKVMLKPHLDVEDGTFRGDIAPTDWNAWFANYQSYILEIAAIAEAENVELLCIGTELRSATSKYRRGNWESLVAAVRAVYSGELTYCALCNDPFLYENDEFGFACLWDKKLGSPLVDVAAVSMYFPMTDKNEPTVEELVAAWTKNADGRNLMKMMARWQRTHGLPVIFGEVGCSRILSANKRPGKSPDLYPGYPTPDPSLTEQNNYAEALLKVWSTAADWFQGMFWWCFHTDDATNWFNANGYPVGNIIKSYYERQSLDVIEGDKSLAPPTKSLPIGLEIGGMDLMEELTERKYRYTRTNGTTATYWTKIGSITLYKTDSAAQSILTIQNGDHGALSSDNALSARGLLYVRIKQESALGTAPFVQLTLLSAAGLVNTDVKAVVVTADSSKSVVEFFIKNKGSFDTILVKDIHPEASKGENIEWKVTDLSSTLPSGTQVTADYADGKFKNLQSNGYDVLTKNSFATATSVKADLSADFPLTTAFTKVPFNVKSTDQKGEWNTTTTEFIASEPGRYVVFACIRVPAQTSGSTTEFRVKVDRLGTMSSFYIAGHQSSNSGLVVLSGEISLRLFNAGDKISIEAANSGSGASVSMLYSTVLISAG